MQNTAYINRAPMAANFTQIQKSLTESVMPPAPKAVLFYLIGKPSSWQVRLTDIKSRLGLTRYTVRKAMQWLQKAGYLFYQRLKTGCTKWQVFDTPQAQTKPYSPAIPPQAEKPQSAFQPVLVILEKTVIKKNNYAAPLVEQPIEKQVVVVIAEIQEVLPKPIPRTAQDDEQISAPIASTMIPAIAPEHQPAAKKILDTITPIQAAAVLAVFVTANKEKLINNRIGYLRALVSAVISGTFTESGGAGGAKQKTAVDYVNETKARLRTQDIKINNADHFAMLQAQYGARVSRTG